MKAADYGEGPSLMLFVVTREQDPGFWGWGQQLVVAAVLKFDFDEQVKIACGCDAGCGGDEAQRTADLHKLNVLATLHHCLG